MGSTRRWRRISCTRSPSLSTWAPTRTLSPTLSLSLSRSLSLTLTLPRIRYVGSNSHLAVVAVLYELGERCNEQLDSFWPLFPQEVASAAPNVTMVDVQAMAERS